MWNRKRHRLVELIRDPKVAYEQVYNLRLVGTGTFWAGFLMFAIGVLESIGVFKGLGSATVLILVAGLSSVFTGAQQRERAEMIEALLDLAKKHDQSLQGEPGKATQPTR